MKKRIASVDILEDHYCSHDFSEYTGTWAHVYAPLLHAEWHGLTSFLFYYRWNFYSICL